MVGRLIGGAAVVAAVAAMSSSAGATTPSAEWTGQYVGNSFSGTYTNLTGSLVNGVSVGTPDKANNPITSFTFAGQTCGLYAPYGSAYCYTNISVAPGKSVSFSGMSMKPLSSAGLQMCDTHDVGATNNCVDVALKPSTTAATSGRKQAASAAFESVLLAISEESTALKDLKNGDTLGARNDLAVASHKLDKALAQPFDAADIAGDLKSARQDDADAWHDLEGTKPGKIGRARKLITTGLGKKHIAALDLNHIAHA